MKDLLQWIPNFFRGMLDVLKEAKKEAGGGWKGQLVFWGGMLMFAILFVIFVFWAVKPAYDNLSEVLSHFNVNITQVDINIPSSIFPQLLLVFLLSVFYLVVLTGFGATIGVLLGTLTSAIFAPKTTGRIDKMFSEVIPLLENLKELSEADEATELLATANDAYARWNKSTMTKMSRWLGQMGTNPKKGSKKDVKL